MKQLAILALAAALLSSLSPAIRSSAQLNNSGSITLLVLDKNKQPAVKITDGDQIQLRAILAGKASQAASVQFYLKDNQQLLGSCTVSAGSDRCDTTQFAALGWYWGSGGVSRPAQTLRASLNGQMQDTSASLDIAPRPVVLVHGFGATWEAWSNYLGKGGYLAQVGLHGYAVGDGQVQGALNTGSLTNPSQHTNTIAQNAAILGETIRQVKQATGAQQVDLISHSMGGLIARYYIDRVMKDRDVAQFIMLGPPNAGTDCANLPASLGLYLPATLELRPSYVRNLFDAQITRQHGVPFHALAGVPLTQGFQSPCTAVPTDLAVSLDSVTGIQVTPTQLPILHSDLNTSPQVFESFVLPLLKTPAGQLTDQADSPVSSSSSAKALQFTRMYTGTLAPGQSQVLTIPIEANVKVASFALFDTTRSLTVTVTGASGNVIPLSAQKNGLVIVDNPSALFYLGYGFANPKPGIWKVALHTTPKTPASGAQYAITSHLEGGAEAQVKISTLLPTVNDRVQINGSIAFAGQPLPILKAQALVRAPDGSQQIILMLVDGTTFQGSLIPAQTGLYSLDVSLVGRASEGMDIERTAFLSFEAQPQQYQISPMFWLGLGACAGLAVLFILGAILLVTSRRKKSKPAGS